MNTLEAIAARRSIRRFRPDPIPDEALRAILNAAIQAPSGKNRQPWRLVVVRGDARAEMVRLMREAVARAEAQGEDTGSAKWSANVMEQAPVTVFVINPDGVHPWLLRSIDQSFSELVDTQSIGAAIQNMLLSALDLGLGSLWICDVLFAYDELSNWVGEPGELIAAVSFGYPDESPGPRPRQAFDDLVVWR
ncbi:MAG: nitroreductase family protein [Anaerolineae bacterium]|nr:nitroreductase family protein [Anaerolineae bacterium]